MEPPKRPREDSSDGRQRGSKGQEKVRSSGGTPTPPCAWSSGETLPSFVLEVKENDVLLGRGAPVIQNEGNNRFRALVQSRKREYQQAQTHNQKDVIARQILEEVARRNGKFLRRVPTQAERRKLGAPDDIAAVWALVDFKTVLEKAKQTLREKDYVRASEQGSREGEEQPQPPAAAESSSVAGTGLTGAAAAAAAAASPSAFPSFASPTDQQMARLVAQRDLLQQSSSSSLLWHHPQRQQQQLRLQLMQQLQRDRLLLKHQQNSSNVSTYAQAAPTAPQSADDQMAFMVQRHNLARANRVRQQQQQLVARQLLMQQQQQQLRSPLQLQLIGQELSRTEAANAALLSLQQQQQQQQQQQAAALDHSSALAQMQMGHSSSQLRPGLSALSSLSSRLLPQPHAAAVTGLGAAAGIDPAYLAFFQQQQALQQPRPLSVGVAADATAASASQRQQQEGKEEQKEPARRGRQQRRSAEEKESLSSGNSEDDDSGSIASSSSDSRREEAKPPTPKKPKPSPE